MSQANDMNSRTRTPDDFVALLHQGVKNSKQFEQAINALDQECWWRNFGNSEKNLVVVHWYNLLLQCACSLDIQSLNRWNHLTKILMKDNVLAPNLHHAEATNFDWNQWVVQIWNRGYEHRVRSIFDHPIFVSTQELIQNAPPHTRSTLVAMARCDGAWTMPELDHGLTQPLPHQGAMDQFCANHSDIPEFVIAFIERWKAEVANMTIRSHLASPLKHSQTLQDHPLVLTSKTRKI